MIGFGIDMWYSDPLLELKKKIGKGNKALCPHKMTKLI
jgi:hypothetical protein